MPRKDPEARRAYNKMRYTRDREKHLAKKREYTARPEVKARKKEYAAAYRIANRAKINAARRADAAANPDKHRARNRKWKAANPDRHRELQQAHLQRKRDLVAAKKALGCSDCGNKDMRVIQLHAPNGHSASAPRQGGRYPHRPRPIGSGNGWSWKALVAELDICIPLCANCHIIRHAEEKEGQARWL